MDGIVSDIAFIGYGRAGTRTGKNGIVPRFSNTLMIGATGMLHDAAAWVAERSERLVLVSRGAGQSSLAELPNVVTVSADWRRPDAFIDSIARADGFVGVQLAVLWIHGNGTEAKRRVLQHLSRLDCLVVNVQGSTALADLKAAAQRRRTPGAGARPITVTLGAVRTGSGQRWLTWDEISAGVIDAIEAEEDRIIGWLP